MSKFNTEIQIGLTIDPKQNIQSDLENLISRLNKQTQIDVSMDFGKSQDKLNAINNLLKSLQSNANKKITLDGFDKTLNNVLNKLEEINGKAIQVDSKKFLNEKSVIESAKYLAEVTGQTYSDSFKRKIVNDFQKGDIDGILQKALKDTESLVAKQTKNMDKEATDDMLKHYKGFAKEISGMKISLKGIELDKEELKQIKADIRGTLSIDEKAGISIDSVMSEIIDKANEHEIGSGFDNKVIQDQILHLGELIATKKELDKTGISGNYDYDEVHADAVRRTTHAYLELIQVLELTEQYHKSDTKSKEEAQYVKDLIKLYNELEMQKIKDYDNRHKDSSSLESIKLYEEFEAERTRKAEIEAQKRQAILEKEAQERAKLESKEDNKWQKLLSDKELAEQKRVIQAQKEAYNELSKLQAKEYGYKKDLVKAEGEYKSELEKTIKTIQTLKDAQKEKISKNNLTDSKEEARILKEQLELQEQLNLAVSKNNTRNSIKDDKNNNSTYLKAQKEAYSEMVKLQNKEFEYKKLLLTAEGEYKAEIEKTLSVVKELQQTQGKNIDDNNLTDIDRENDLLNKRIALQTELNLLISKKNTLEANKETSSNNKYAQEKADVKTLISQKTKLLEIEKQIMSRKYGDVVDTSKIDGFINKLQSMDNISLKGVRNEIKNIDIEIKQMKEDARQAQSVLSGFQTALGNIGFYVDIGDIFRGFIKTAKEAVQHSIAVENEMINLRRVYEMSDASARDFQNTTQEMSVSLASTNAETIKAVTAFKKLGYSIEESMALTETTTKFNLSADINDMEKATTSLISTLKGFKLEASDAVAVTDAINQVANNFAVSSDDIITSLAKDASALKVAGNDINQAISLGTVANEVVQDAGKVGNALKIRGLVA